MMSCSYSTLSVWFECTVYTIEVWITLLDCSCNENKSDFSNRNIILMAWPVSLVQVYSDWFPRFFVNGMPRTKFISNFSFTKCCGDMYFGKMRRSLGIKPMVGQCIHGTTIAPLKWECLKKPPAMRPPICRVYIEIF